MTATSERTALRRLLIDLRVRTLSLRSELDSLTGDLPALDLAYFRGALAEIDTRSAELLFAMPAPSGH